ncbi:MAG TPA: RHS repeat-associated core domain-containing protein, partial [Pyrinomonadaceae bacterium]|nr:RHS repeat-associated core domain-containing protein [Pyrinomonadaceae bacterium]
TIPGMAVTGNDKVWRKFNFASVTTTKIMVEVTDVAGDNHTQIVEVEAYGPAPPVNVALATNGATVSASGTYPGFATANVNNGDRLGWNFNWWTDHTSDFNPDWIQVDFAGPRTINEIDVVGLQEPWSNPVEPTLELTARYALTNFQVQYWTGTAFVDVPGGSVTGNNKVWRKFTFDSLTTSKIRVTATYVAGDNHTQVVELEAWSPAAGGAEINWLVADQLGTPRLIFDKTGALDKTKHHDYLPFGEEISIGTGGRTAGQGYTGDNVRQKFTSKERDNETGLDYFNARYYASLQGRFNSIDPVTLSPERLGDPQQINLYGHVRNNPSHFIDPVKR